MSRLFMITEARWERMSIPERNSLLLSPGKTRDEAAEIWEGLWEAEGELEAERRNERYWEEGSESFQAGRWAEEEQERMMLE